MAYERVPCGHLLDDEEKALVEGEHAVAVAVDAALLAAPAEPQARAAHDGEHRERLSKSKQGGSNTGPVRAQR